MNSGLNEWITEAQFWKTQKDIFQIQDVNFLKSQKKFYIELFLSFSNMLREYEEKKEISNKEEMLLIAESLLMFSDEETSFYFYGIDYNEAILYSACIFYMLGYNFNSCILVQAININELESDTSKIIVHIFKNAYHQEDEIVPMLKKSNDELNYDLLRPVISLLNDRKNNCNDSNEYIFTKILFAIVKRIYIDNNKLYIDKYSKVDINLWKEFIQRQTSLGKITYNFSLFQKSIIKRNLFEENIFYLNFVSRKEKYETIQLIIFEELYSGKENRLLYIHNNLNYLDQMSIIRNLSIKNYTVNPKIDFIEIENLINDPQVLENYSTIIFDDINTIGDFRLGVKYEYLIGKVKNSGRKLILIDNSMYFFDINNVLGLNNVEQINSNLSDLNIYYYNQKKNSYVLGLLDRLEIINDKTLLKNVFENNFKLKKFNKDNNIHKSFLTAFKLIDKGNRVFIFIPQVNSDTMGIISKCEILINFLAQDNNNVLIDAKIPSEVIDKFKTLFGDEHIFTKLIHYGVIAFYPEITREIQEYFNFIISKYNIKLVLGNISVIEYKFLKEFDCMIIYSLKYKYFEAPYWVPMDEEDVYKLIYKFSCMNKLKRVFLVSENDSKVFYNNIQKCVGRIRLKSHIEKCFMKQIQNRFVLTNINKCLKELEFSLADYLLQENASYDIIQYLESGFVLTDKNKIDYTILAPKVNERVIKLKKLHKSELFKIKKLKVDMELLSCTSNFIKSDAIRIRDIIELLGRVIGDIILNLEDVEDKISELNLQYDGRVLTKNDISLIIIKWIEGKSYKEIQLDFNLFTLQEIIGIISSFSGNLVCSKLSLINDIVLNETSQCLFDNIELIYDFIVLGGHNLISIYLYKLGIFDRALVSKITSFIESKYINYELKYESIKNVILKNTSNLQLSRLELDIIESIKDK